MFQLPVKMCPLQPAALREPRHVTAFTAQVMLERGVPAESVELTAARKAGVPLLKRARALGALIRDDRVIGIAGTHGKTTITALTGLACEEAGLDPTVLVGGEMPGWSGYARSGTRDLVVVEADEFDRSFLELEPTLAVVSSLEAELRDKAAMVDARGERLSAVEMELGCDGVLMNTGIAGAKDPVLMAEAMREAVSAGRKAFLAGRIAKKLYAKMPEVFEKAREILMAREGCASPSGRGEGEGMT